MTSKDIQTPKKNGVCANAKDRTNEPRQTETIPLRGAIRINDIAPTNGSSSQINGCSSFALCMQ